MVCHNCKNECQKRGKDRKGNQRYACLRCRKTFGDAVEKPLDNMYLPLDKAVRCIQLMVEGCSLRSIERIEGVSLHTLLDLLVLVGEKCERFLRGAIKQVEVEQVQVDEVWSFVFCKEKTKERLAYSGDEIGDAYCFTAVERKTKLLLTWHLGRRTYDDTATFINKLDDATKGRFQLSTDGFSCYPEAIYGYLGSRVDYGQVIKTYGPGHDADHREHRYSPSKVEEIRRIPKFGSPEIKKICTSHVERHNLTIRMQMRRLTRLTNGFSKKHENLKAAYALFFAFYNFCRVHSTIRVTPAMESKLTDHVWSIGELLSAA